jgi:hypothetical protein
MSKDFVTIEDLEEEQEKPKRTGISSSKRVYWVLGFLILSTFILLGIALYTILTPQTPSIVTESCAPAYLRNQNTALNFEERSEAILSGTQIPMIPSIGLNIETLAQDIDPENALTGSDCSIK